MRDLPLLHPWAVDPVQWRSRGPLMPQWRGANTSMTAAPRCVWPRLHELLTRQHWRAGVVYVLPWFSLNMAVPRHTSQ